MDYYCIISMWLNCPPGLIPYTYWKPYDSYLILILCSQDFGYARIVSYFIGRRFIIYFTYNIGIHQNNNNCSPFYKFQNSNFPALFLE